METQMQIHPYETMDVKNCLSVQCTKTHAHVHLLISGLQELCGKILTSPSGIILSPDLDENGSYDDMVECSWIIKASDKQIINLKFVYLRLEDRSYEGTNELICRFDYVMVE